jgi:hypothetical protein
MPTWLQERNYTQDLSQLVEQLTLSPENQAIAEVWLQKLGVDTAALTTIHPGEEFYNAYLVSDQFDSQGIVTVFYYSSKQRNRVQGLCFLLDYNPPWQGAVKDLLTYPKQTPEQVDRSFVRQWQQQGLTVTQIRPEDAKKRIFKALQSNRAEKIRLPRDLVAARNLFTRYILTLPSDPGTRAFSLDDFDTLSHQGKQSETLWDFERTFGRRIRLEDGQELFIDNAVIDELDDG